MIKTTRTPLAIVTGGTSGIGLAVSRALIDQGYYVIAASIDSNSSGSGVDSDMFKWIPTDVRSEKQVIKLFQIAAKKQSTLKVLVNCAGIGVFKNLENLTSKDWKNVIDTNLTGSFFCSKLAFNLMRNKGGRIIHLGSISDHIGLCQNGAYAASKFGLRGLSAVINEEGKKYGIMSTLISAGAVYTRIWSDRKEFNANDMLSVSDISQVVVEIVSKGNNVRIDEIKVFPSKGIL